MKHSDIFENFAKIAQEKGIISDDAPEKAKKKLEKDHRWDSMTLSDIEALYGVKPDSEKELEYKRNIIEVAHPGSMVISPSYDKLNGLVETDNERQDIILNIVNKTPNGQLTNHKYAEKELTLSLVRIGNDMDNKDNKDLMKLADTCLMQLSDKDMKKKVASPLVIGVAVGAAAIIGGLYLQQHLPFANDGFKTNNKKLLEEVDDLIQSNSNWGVGIELSQEFRKTLSEFRSKIVEFYNTYMSQYEVISSLQKPRTAKELIPLAKGSESGEVKRAYDIIKAQLDDFLPYLNTIEANFKKESYKADQISEKGFLTKLVDKTQILHGGKGLVADDFDDVNRAIPPYKKSISEIFEILIDAGSLAAKTKSTLEKAKTEASEIAQEMKAKKDEMHQGIKDLEKSLQMSGIK